MTKSRLETFSDGVIAIIITIMVLELKIPHEATFAALGKLVPIALSYLMSFVFVAIYWGNHHHLLHTVQHVTTGIMWSNMGLLFALSLIPFTTGWMGENHFANIPVSVYGMNLLLCAVTFYFLQRSIMKHQPHTTKLIEALRNQEKKGIVSLLLYTISVICAFWLPLVSATIFIGTAVWWVIPDKHIEQALKE